MWVTLGLAAGCAAGYYFGATRNSNNTTSPTTTTTTTTTTTNQSTFGFIGCGTITSAIVTGLCTLPLAERPTAIIVSPRNAAKAAALASQFPTIVQVATTNQEVLDRSTVVFLAVIPQIAKQVIPTLTFQSTHTIISVIAALSIAELAPMVQPVPRGQICRAIPLPAVAVQKGATIITEHPEAKRIFNLLGTAVIARDSKEFEVLMCISCMMGPFYKTCGVLSNWFVDNGVAPSTASSLTIAFHHTVLSEAEHRERAVASPRAFEELVSEQTPGRLGKLLLLWVGGCVVVVVVVVQCSHLFLFLVFIFLQHVFALAGGLNEGNVRDMSASGTFDEYTKALNKTLKRLRGEVELTEVE